MLHLKKRVKKSALLDAIAARAGAAVVEDRPSESSPVQASPETTELKPLKFILAEDNPVNAEIVPRTR